MALHDVTNLYTNIPIKETIEIIKTSLNTKEVSAKEAQDKTL